MAGDGRAGAGQAGGDAACGGVPRAEQAEMLAEVLAGVELGAWDRRIVDWLAGRWAELQDVVAQQRRGRCGRPKRWDRLMPAAKR